MEKQTLAYNIFIEKFLTPFCAKNLFWREANSGTMYIDAKRDYECSKIEHDFKNGYSHFTFRKIGLTAHNKKDIWQGYYYAPDIKKIVSFHDILQCNKVSFKRIHKLNLP